MSSVKPSAQDPQEYLSRGWFPVNSTLLKDIQQKLKAGKYNQDRDGLIQDLKNDFALFGHCLKNIGNSQPTQERERSPLDLLREVEIQSLRQMIEVPADQISPHLFDPRARHQTARVKHFVVSCSAAEVMADKTGIDSDVAYSCALTRQLGMTLVAFNYPRIYSQALSMLKSEADDLERILKKTLGFSPMQVGAKSVLGWSRYVPLRIALGETSQNADQTDPLNAFRERDAAHKQGEELKHICQVGEALARLNDGEHFPGSAKQWDTVKSEVRNLLGPTGMEIIGAKVRVQQSAYLAIAADAFRTEISPERNVRATNAHHVKQMLAENNFLKGLPASYREEFEKMYQSLVRGQVSTEALNILVGRIIPMLGFERGCIYISDMKRMRLVPTVRIGDIDLTRMRAFNMGDTAYTNPVLDALSSSTPIRQENVVFNDGVVSHISGAFGNREKGGVLHLQMGHELVSVERGVSLLYFKAVRQALNDCLDLH